MAKPGKKTASVPRRRRVSRRFAIAAIGVLLLVFAGVHIVHGSGSKHLAAKAVHHSTRGRLPCATPAGRRAARIHAGCRLRRHVAHRPPLTAIQRYARSLLPIADRSRSYFDSAVVATGAASISDLEGVCTHFGSRVNLLTYQAAGVAPAGHWYDPVNQLHRQVMGVYHDMQGALLNCSIAGENGDSQGAAVAQQDVNSADRRMRSIDDVLHRLARSRSPAHQ